MQILRKDTDTDTDAKRLFTETNLRVQESPS